MRTHDSATRVDTDPHGNLHGMQAKGQVGNWIGPKGIVDSMFGRDKGGRTRPNGQRKVIRVFALLYVRFPFLFFYVRLNASLCL